MSSAKARRLLPQYVDAVFSLNKTLDAVQEMDLYCEFLQKTLVEHTHMTSEEIRASWRIYKEAHSSTPTQEVTA